MGFLHSEIDLAMMSPTGSSNLGSFERPIVKALAVNVEVNRSIRLFPVLIIKN